ncbi:hypothetical protein SAMN04488087_1043 [Rhodothermus profundi]|uniref:Uncharacterized protein n=1 Tax=Rhodothermus profundi TaxID=633813 RepID=A0A1M6SD82_9BACT|nr:hypothetical protein SAMN04488087_1043 [Rhodothermus profundi]
MKGRLYHIAELLPGVLKRLQATCDQASSRHTTVPIAAGSPQKALQRIENVISTRARTSMSPTA